MRPKQQLHTEEVARILGLTSLELVKNCPDQRSVFPTKPCTNRSCPWGIREKRYMNCSFVASECGEHTLEAIGEMMGITREGARLIERRGLLKLRLNQQIANATAAVHQPSLASGPNLDASFDEALELPNESDDFSAFDDRKLA